MISQLQQAFATPLRLLRKQRIDPLVIGDILRQYDRFQFHADLRAGVNVAMLAFPQGMAYSMVAGLPPVHGLQSAGFGSMVGALFSGTRLVAIGPGNSTCIMIFSGLVASCSSPCFPLPSST